MSIHRYAAKRDTSEPSIVAALESAGYEVERLSKPVDLRVRKAWYPRGINMLLECKTPTASGRVPIDKRQIAQNGLIARGGALRVATPEAALDALWHFELVITP